MTLIQVRAKIEVPRVPNFILYDGGKFRLGELSDEDLRRIGVAWTEALIARAEEQWTVHNIAPWDATDD